MKDQMEAYRKAYSANDFEEATALLEKSELKKDKNSQLLWLMETGTLSLAKGDETTAITQFVAAIEMIDRLYTKQIGSKAASFLLNDASDVFYGASYERSYAHYFLSKAYYSRYQKTKNKADLQGARGTILAWDTYFTEPQRSAAVKTIYQTDLMLKVFGGEIHEISEISNDKQISLQLYKDAIKILDSMGGAFSLFNAKNIDFIKAYEEALGKEKGPPAKLYEQTTAYKDLKNFLHYKVLSLTKDVRGFDYQAQLKALKPVPQVLEKLKEGKPNVVIVLEDGLIPRKSPRPFNFGLKGAVGSVDNSGAKAFIATVGAEILTAFAMEKLGMTPGSFNSTGGFIFAHDVTKLAVQEAAIQFELPMIEQVPKLTRYEIIITDSKGAILKREPMSVISENGDIARLVLEEDVVARYVKTGTRVAVKHLIAIVAAMQVYRTLKKGNDAASDFLAKTAAMGTYIGASKGIAALEKADVRHWTTLPQAFRLSEFNLPVGTYQVGISVFEGDKPKENATKSLGSFTVNESGKAIHTFKLMQF